MIPPPPPNTELVRMIYIGSTAVVLFVAFLTLVWGLAMAAVYRRDGKRHREGRCLRCGYDLSHTTDRCPECGETIQTVRKP